MGAQVSISETIVENETRSSIDTIMESDVKGDVNVLCKNLQLVEGARGCNIQFADQRCDAAGISNLTSKVALDAELGQQTYNNIKQATEAANEGMGWGQVSFSDTSSFTKNIVDLSMSTTQKFATSCTRNVSAINLQSVKDCVDSYVNFKPQDVSAEVLGDCAVENIGKLKSMQELTNVMDISAKSSNKGMDLWALLLLLAFGFLAIVFFIPMLGYGLSKMVRGSSTSKDKDKDKSSPASGGMPKWKYYYIMFSIFLFFMVFLGWWPCFGAYYLGIWPYSYTGVLERDGKEAACVDGKNINPELFLNTWMWSDPLCLTKGGKCRHKDDSIKHYNNCGLFASSFGCDDPEFLQDKEEYIESIHACAPLLGVGFSKCTSRHIAADVFADKATYGKCHRCEDEENYGLWAAEGKSCSGISKEYYKRTNEPCSPDDPEFCKEDADSAREESPNECMEDAYQDAKRKFSMYWRACKEMQTKSRITKETLGTQPLISQQCPPDPFDYLTKCSSSSKKCTYTPKEGDQADPRVIGSCKNDLEACCYVNEMGDKVCLDEDLQEDMFSYDNANRYCKEQWDRHNTLNPWAVIGSVILLLLLLFVPFYFIATTPGAITSVTEYGQSGKTSNTKHMFAFIMFLVVYFASAWPFGLLGLADGGSALSFYEEGVLDGMDSIDEKKARIGGYTGLGVSIFIVVAYVTFMYKKDKGKDESLGKPLISKKSTTLV